jgi:phage shock protein E
MKTFFKNLFANEKINIGEIAQNGALIVDVRSPGEFKQGHVKDSVNIPLSEIGKNIEMLKENQPLILCCASGMRSSTAASELKAKGLTEVYNGGSWQKVNIQIKKTGE